jgi:hypothetical protein
MRISERSASSSAPAFCLRNPQRNNDYDNLFEFYSIVVAFMHSSHGLTPCAWFECDSKPGHQGQNPRSRLPGSVCAALQLVDPLGLEEQRLLMYVHTPIVNALSNS